MAASRWTAAVSSVPAPAASWPRRDDDRDASSRVAARRRRRRGGADGSLRSRLHRLRHQRRGALPAARARHSRARRRVVSPAQRHRLSEQAAAVRLADRPRLVAGRAGQRAHGARALAGGLGRPRARRLRGRARHVRLRRRPLRRPRCRDLAGLRDARAPRHAGHATDAVPQRRPVAGLAAHAWPAARVARVLRCDRARVLDEGSGGLLPLLIIVVWALAGERRQRLALLSLPRGLALLAALVAPWPLIGAFGHAAGLRAAVVNDQLAWYLPRSLGGAALVSPLQNAFGILFPWVLLTPLIVVQAVRALRGRGGERDTVQLLLLWSAVTFVAVGLSAQQRVSYYLPLLPPVALLTGWWVAGVVVRHRTVARVPWGVYAAVAGALVVSGVVTLAARPDTRVQLAAAWPAWGALILVLAVIGLAAAAAVALSPATRRRSRAFTLACVVAAIAAVGGYRADTHRPTTEEFGRLEAQVQPLAGQGGAVVVWDVADLPLNFYLRRPILEVHTGEALARALDGHAAVAVVGERVVQSAPSPAGVTVLWRATLGSRGVAVLAPDR